MRAIGGMRNPHLATSRLPGSKSNGEAVRKLLVKAQELWPRLQDSARAILGGEQPGDLPEEIVDRIRQTLLNTLWTSQPRTTKTARARTPIHSEVIAAWKFDPDSRTLADWLDHGAPMGFDTEIQSTGIFPKVENRAAQVEAPQVEAKTLKGWTNYSSATEENQELQKLIPRGRFLLSLLGET